MKTRVPRFSPSFSVVELGAALKALAVGDDRGKVEAFEHAFARYIGVKHAVMVGSARMGAYLVMKGWGLEPGDEVMLPGFTYFSIPSILLPLGIRPVFVDVDPGTFLMDPEDFERKLTGRTRVVVPTHLYGFPCAMDPILKAAWGAGVKVLEDCAQATGARYHGKRVGSFGDAAYYTFGLTKNITTLKGGMVTTDDDDLAEFLHREMARRDRTPLEPLVKELAVGVAMMAVTDPRVYPFTLHPVVRRLHGWTGRDILHDLFEEAPVLYEEEPGWFRTSNARAVQAAVGLVQLSRIDRLNGMRTAHGRFLLEHLSHVSGLEVPRFVSGAEPIFMSFPIRVSDPGAVAKRLLDRGIDSTRGYMSDCSRLPILQGKVTGECPHAAEVERQILHIPVHPNLTRRDLNHVAEAVRQAVLHG